MNANAPENNIENETGNEAPTSEFQKNLHAHLTKTVMENADTFNQLPDWTPEADKKLRTVTQGLLKGNLFYKDLFKFSDAHLEIVYSEAYNLYNAGKYDKAETAFRGLCFLHPVVGKYWLGLGASLQMQKRLPDALEAYGLGMLQDPESPKLFMHAAECLLALGKHEESKEMLKGAIEMAKKDPKHKDLLARAQKLLELLQKQFPKAAK